MRALPPGFRFHATDEELLIHYLKPKILGRPGERYYDMIPEIDICKFEPWQLPAMFCHRFNSKELFFFCRVKRKYSNSKRSDRTTEAGYWKVTGKERAIMSEDTDEPIGIKKTLVFYTGRVPKGKRTNWVSHEYQLNPKCLGHNEDEASKELRPKTLATVGNSVDLEVSRRDDGPNELGLGRVEGSTGKRQNSVDTCGFSSVVLLGGCCWRREDARRISKMKTWLNRWSSVGVGVDWRAGVELRARHRGRLKMGAARGRCLRGLHDMLGLKTLDSGFGGFVC
ncbi:protein CUP-SHAPED COTYLEDON 2 [Eucalyptus grandis]|uniref:protein CUP-SHAPED COTYLEDON 2 n=1 Tax=Eucalyptus grandis TaxID=71139 RepID=UPI00192EB997|nr:protein CUP-SHAPED COTYLEDON 2 [Eucalyptus grandis]